MALVAINEPFHRSPPPWLAADCPPMNPSLSSFFTISRASLVLLANVASAQDQTNRISPPPVVDPIVKASAYGDKTVWSYAAKDPLPWTLFKPNDFGSAKVAFESKGVKPIGEAPAAGVHPRIFFSPQDLPGLRKRIKEDKGAQEAWKNILAWSHALKLTYDENADYAKPDWANGAFSIHGRFEDLMRIGGYKKTREDYYALLAAGKAPKYYEHGSPADFFGPAAAEAFRCLIDDDAEGGKKLAAATITAIRLEQERRAGADKPVDPGQPPRPSTSRRDACALGFIYDFNYQWLSPAQRKIVHDELVTLSAWDDNYGTFNNAEGSRSNWATFSYWVFDLMAIEGEPGFNDLKFRGLYRGWRDFYTYSFFNSGAAYEGEGKLLLGLDAAVAFDRVGRKYQLEPLTQHPLPRAYYANFSSLAMLPTRNSFAVFDILGGISGGFTTPHDLVVAKYLYPEDKTVDLVYRAMVADDYRNLPHSLHSLAHQDIISAIFATSYDPELDPVKLKLPLSFFCGQRALMMTRSSWERDATFLTMHVRGASGGHPYRDRNGIMLAGKGRPWITIPGHGGEVDGRVCNTVLIDGADQSNTTPGRVVDYVDKPMATFTVGDSKYCWDWVWSEAGKTPEGDRATRQDIEKGNVAIGDAWKPVEQCFNDFAFTKVSAKTYDEPLKFRPDWLAVDGIYSATVRQINTPVLKSFRTAGIVRGPRPYVVVVDDIQRDCLPAGYALNLNLESDLVAPKTPPPGTLPGDLLFAGTKSLDSGGAIKGGEPALLIRLLEAKGKPVPAVVREIDKQKILTLSTKAAAPEFKLLLYPFKAGEPLPETKWSAAKTSVTIAFPEQKDTITFTPAKSGKTDLKITRASAEIVAVNAPVRALKDPESDLLTAELSLLPKKVAALGAFDPEKLPGLIASWNFDGVKSGGYPSGQASVPPIPAGETTLEPGISGQAVNVPNSGLVVPFKLKGVLDQEATFSFWVRSNGTPNMGDVISVNGFDGFSLSLKQGSLGLDAIHKWANGGPLSASLLTGWTHYAMVSDGKTLKLYGNGRLQLNLPATKKVSFSDKFTLGGGSNGGFPGSFDDLRIYNKALDAETIQKIYLKALRDR